MTDHHGDSALQDGDVMTNAVSPWRFPSLTRLLHRRFGSDARRTHKTADANLMHIEGSGHVDIGYGRKTEIYLDSSGDEIRLVVQSVSGEQEESVSAVLDADSARELGEELVHRSDQLDESD